VQHLNIVEDLHDEDGIMAIVVRQGWTLAIVFEVGQSDTDSIEKTKFKHGDAHFRNWT
jgi:hypothetical protein